MYADHLKEVVKKAVESNVRLLISGAPGVGKTQIITQVAEEIKYELILEHPSVSDPTDYKGFPFPDKDGKQATFLPFANLAKIITATTPTIVFIDDIGQAPPSVQAALMQLLDGGKLNGHVVSDQVVFIGATNRAEDRAAVSGLLEPVKSRFFSIINLAISKENIDPWLTWAFANGIDEMVTGFMRWRPALLHDFKATAALTNSPSPRTAEHLSDMVKSGIVDFKTPYAMELITGCSGEGFAIEFMAYAKVHATLPNPLDIFADPKSVPVPDDPATLYALMGALIGRAKPENAEAVIQWSAGVPKEMAFKLVADLAKKTPGMRKNTAYRKWMKENQQYFNVK